jgi:transcriptional regulator with XRE-family HTH domain
MGVATIGSALVEKRLELGLDKGQAAEVIGMSRTTYSSYEQDSQRPSVDVFPALAEFLGISTESLLTLYGATCIAAIRPSLERVASHQGEAGEAAANSRARQPSTDETTEGSALPREEAIGESESASTPSVLNSEAVQLEEVLESPELLDDRAEERLPDIEVDESVSDDADENVSPDVEVDESVSRERELSAEDIAMAAPIVSESYPPPRAYSSKKKSDNKKKKKKKKR